MDELNDSSYLRRPALRVKNNRSCSATTCGILQIVTYVLLMALTIFYLAYFAYTNDKLKKNSSGSDCLFFAKSDDRLGPSGTCSFFMGGSGVSIGLLFILILLGIFSTLCGKWLVSYLEHSKITFRVINTVEPKATSLIRTLSPNINVQVTPEMRTTLI